MGLEQNSFELPLDLKSLIQAIPTPFTNRGRERISWKGNLRGTFDLRSAYRVFWTSNLQDWIKINSKDRKSCLQGNPPWNIIFPIAVWNLWKSRNVFIFKRKSQKPNLSKEIVNQAVEFLCYVASPRNPTQEVRRSIR